MPSLFESNDQDHYEKCLKDFYEKLKNIGKDRLEDLERWYQEELPASIKSKGYLEKCDLVKLVDWKLTRGKWRPRLLDFAKAADEDHVVKVSKKAFAVLDTLKEDENCPADTLKESLKYLTELKGVGPATAMGILSAKHSSIPFMSDEALLAALSSKDYTVAFALKLTDALQEKANELNTTSVDSNRKWTAKLIEQCLFIETRAQNGSGARVVGKKRNIGELGGATKRRTATTKQRKSISKTID